VFIADVYRGEYREQKVAVKVLKDSSKAAQQFLTEASVMSFVSDPSRFSHFMDFPPGH
jgi:hypothetical protein